MIVKERQDEIENFLSDASNYKGNSNKVFIPESVDEFRELLKNCFRNNIKVTLSAARTGLTGASVPIDEVVVSTERLNKIKKIDKSSKRIILEPGVVIADMQNEINRLGLFYPPNPTEQNSTVGGNIATNASGAKTFKYGATRKYVKRLKLLFANGNEINLNRGDVIEDNGYLDLSDFDIGIDKISVKNISLPNIKHAAGYYIKPNMDLIDLFIGSEGTLAGYTEIELEVLKSPEKVFGGLIFFDDYDKLLSFINTLRDESLKQFAKSLSSSNCLEARLIEYFDDKSLDLLRRKKYGQIPENAIAAIWVEQEYQEDNEDFILQNWYDFIPKYTHLTDKSWFAIDEATHKKLAEFRHDLPLFVFELISENNSFKIGTDTAVPSKYLDHYFHYLKILLEKSGLNYFIWGHIGNTHFHANMITSNEEEYNIAQKVYLDIIKEALKCDGTVSAEHGIGKLKKKYLCYMFDEEIINYMKKIKLLFDPNSLLNSRNLFDF